MKILFIRPNMADTRSLDAMDPLAFAILSGLTPPECEKAFIDERLEPIPDNLAADLVAISVETFTARHAYEIAEGFRQRGIPVVLGGYHPTLMPEEALQHADAIAIGDAETTWPQILQDAQKGQLQKIYQGEQTSDLAGIKYDRSLFQGKRYAPIKPVQFGRGCKFACDFCSIHAFYGHECRQRPIQEVVEEIRALGAKNLFFVDDNLFANESLIKPFLEAITPLGVRWGCQISIDVTNNEDLLALMRKSGCMCVQIGFETLNPQNLGLMHKGVNIKQGSYEQAIDRLEKHGIMVYGTFIFGYDYDTPDSFKPTVEFALRHRFFLANFNPLMTMPGTRLYKRLKEEGRLRYDAWWLNPDFRYGEAMLTPQGMQMEELTQGCLKARLDFNSSRSMLWRSLGRANRATLGRFSLFWAANWISRKEILSKQGSQLGKS